GLLGLVEFYTQTAAPKSVLFGVVKWKDPTSEDICKSENKGEFFMGGGSLPVELSAFTARAVDDYILLQWRTESEKDTRGFNVLRAQVRDGNYERINAALIAAAGYSSSPIDYQYSDRRVQAGVIYYYKLEQIDVNGGVSHYGPVQVILTGVQEETMPASFVLHDNFPNPFNPHTTIKFELPTDEFVTLEIYNIAGVKVRTLIQALYSAGVHAAPWDGANDDGDKVSSGAYLYKITAGAFVKNSKMMLLN
ncbi:T9SS type A sorting domain-containing protein, partial [candidate division KSB1 bacterium]|nr:T9SS type A sorting domain-containing protein [candidate division KSB1 bacterium]